LNYTREWNFRFSIADDNRLSESFQNIFVLGCRFVIHSTRCAHSGQVLQAAKNIAKWTAL